MKRIRCKMVFYIVALSEVKRMLIQSKSQIWKRLVLILSNA